MAAVRKGRSTDAARLCLAVIGNEAQPVAGLTQLSAVLFVAEMPGDAAAAGVPFWGVTLRFNLPYNPSPADGPFWSYPALKTLDVWCCSCFGRCVRHSSAPRTARSTGSSSLLVESRNKPADIPVYCTLKSCPAARFCAVMPVLHTSAT